MASGNSSGTGRTSRVNLVRSSHPWTTADSAAGFVLRYLTPMRRQLTASLGSTQHADEALKRLLAHLVNAGFGDHKQGRLRDFLLRGIRSAAKSLVEELTIDDRPEGDLNDLTVDSRQWVTYWREGLLERAWRALERQEHASPRPAVYSVLYHATANRDASPAELADILNSKTDLEINAAEVHDTLPNARAAFAQLIADEVAETLERPTGDDVRREINQLGLGKAFSGISVVSRPPSTNSSDLREVPP